MKIPCPQCQSLLSWNQVNVKKDVALCTKCGQSFSVSKSLKTKLESQTFDVMQPPSGAWFQKIESGWTVGAAAGGWSLLYWFFAMYIMAKMLLLALFENILKIANEPALNWFQIAMQVVLLLFLTAFASIALMLIAGKYVVSVVDNDGQLFIGIGSIGWRRRFDWRGVCNVSESLELYNHGVGDSPPVTGLFSITLSGRTHLTFGQFLNSTRSYYMAQTLRRMLAERKLQDRQVNGN